MDKEKDSDIMKKILITPRSFGKTDKSVFNLFKDAGYQIVTNPYGQILTKEQMIENIKDAVGIIVGVDPLDKDVIDKIINQEDDKNILEYLYEHELIGEKTHKKIKRKLK